MLEHKLLQQRSIAAAISVVAHVDYQTLRDCSNKNSDEKSDLEITIDENLFGDDETIGTMMNTDYSLTIAGIENTHLYGEQEKIYYHASSKEEEPTHFQLYDVQAETMTPPEMEETFVDMQYAVVLGQWTEMDFRDRRRFALSIMFDRALFNLYELDRGVTREVNYTAY